MRRFPILLGALFMAACGRPAGVQDNIIYVSIAPLKYMVEQIADTTVSVRVLVPETSSPETFEPTVQQITRLADARAYIAIGLIDFEHTLRGSVMSVAPDISYLDLSQGISVLEGSCSHNHSAGEHGHNHLVDPHIWLSPSIMGTIAQKITRQMAELRPEHETEYYARLDLLTASIDSLDRYIRQSFADLSNRSFAIGHPSLTYYAHDYGLTQIPIEMDGKEPGLQQMKTTVDLLRSKGITTILTQQQTSAAAAEAVAREMAGRVVLFDPLAEKWLANMYYLTDLLSNSMSGK